MEISDRHDDPAETSLRGQTALITGAAKRLGRAVAEALADRGVHVVLHYRQSQDEAELLADELRGRGVDCWTIGADLDSPEAARDLLPRAVERCGRPVDILINSASIFEPSLVLEFSPEDLDRNMRVNALAPLLLCRSMAAQGRAGQIVNFLDTRIVEYDRLHAAYHLSKRALFTITRMLALELAPAIRVNAVAPGLILPPPDRDNAYLEKLARNVPLQRHGSAEDVVRAVMFLLESDFVTGQVIFLDGGQHLRGNMYGA